MSQEDNNIKNYRINMDKIVGKGGYGTVYEACKENEEKGDEEEDCNYVAKIIKYQEYQERDERENNKLFEKEVRIQTIAAENGISPKIMKARKIGNQGIIIMEKMSATLQSVLENMKTREDMERIAVEIGDCLMTLHSLGIYHNDAHYKNFMVNNKGKVKIIDFGSAYESSYGKENKEQVKEMIRKDYYVLIDDFVEDKDIKESKRHTPFLVKMGEMLGKELEVYENYI